MSKVVKEPHHLKALLATMKSAKDQNVRMSIWDRDIKAIEDAISIIDSIRAVKQTA